MSKILFRPLKIEECDRIKELDASHYVKRAWREVNGIRQLVDINYQDSDYPNGFEEHNNRLKETILNGGVAYGAFDVENNQLIGFVSLNRDVFGEQYKYVLLDQLFISLEHRNKGLGKRLFYLCVDTAKTWNVDKIYICAGSSEETIAFYFAIGCIEALEVNQTLYEDDPRDYQLEYSVIR